MNIVKFTDIFIEGDDLYNDVFRGKYCYAPRLTWAIPFEDITESDYYALEKYDAVDGFPEVRYILIDNYTDHIDEAATERANSIAKFISFNSFVPDDHITIEELKLFRKWLAETLLSMDADVKEYDEKTVQMLSYYANDMYDEVIKQLTNFRVIDNKIVFSTASTCNCTPVIGSQLQTTSSCDPIMLYRQSIYEFMVKTFSDIDFWKELDKEFLSEFKLYIDGIIDYNLPLYTSEYISEFADCSCVNLAETTQQLLQHILKNLSASLQYMIEDKIDGHKNFVGDSLREWSSKLYEKMRW